MEEIINVEEKRGRGRPKKAEEEKINEEVKRGRGRPRKAEEDKINKETQTKYFKEYFIKNKEAFDKRQIKRRNKQKVIKLENKLNNIKDIIYDDNTRNKLHIQRLEHLNNKLIKYKSFENNIELN